MAIDHTDELSEALGGIVNAFGAETGTFHLLEEDGLLHLKAVAEVSAARARSDQNDSDRQRHGGTCR